ncbi:MAG TPA: carboxymuconolactone decarboxylase family protein [Xanthobacteraceae bacterium]|jgi:AhpD family alkylhydroperoxidase|nr:carboxymuconolactone decarboxylase family protein [Xanthobacteraceae bacterium]
MSQRLDYAKIIPDAMKALGTAHSYVARSGLSRELIDLVYLRVSLINGCAYCIDMHTRDLLKGGMKPEKVALVPVYWEAKSFFTEQERAALAWAESLTLISETRAPDDVYHAVARQFDEKQLGDLTVAISLMNAYNRIAIGFRREPGH